MTIDVETLYTAARELTTSLLPRLQRLIPEEGSALESSTGLRGKRVAAPIPWNDAAAMLFYEIHGDARRYESLLTLRLFGTARYRPGSDAHTTACLNRLPVLLAHGIEQRLDPLDLVDPSAALASWPRRVRHALDETRPGEQRWTTAPGGLRCPHCARPLAIPPGWDSTEIMPDLHCRTCRDDDGQGLRWAPDSWLGLLQDDPDLLTEADVLAQYEIGSSTLRSWVRRGRIEPVGRRHGRRTFHRRDIDAVIGSGPGT